MIKGWKGEMVKFLGRDTSKRNLEGEGLGPRAPKNDWWQRKPGESFLEKAQFPASLSSAIACYHQESVETVEQRFTTLESFWRLSSSLIWKSPEQSRHRRLKLFEGNPTKQILTYTKAVKTIDPMKALGKPHTLWVAFAKLYEQHKDLANARVIFDKVVQVNYKTVDNLASV
ncbi:hypothetical protein VNO77_33699 [Canavalia gladiata]|uniref:Pre-mRNA-splicing factor Syf1/CRNKL1-like C-terminal HAT-repeats domain-containing protein n=1 Tax=Canavalia gladiata TaxID=3824 RepID=A0AAN9KEA6_CANGL